jgi:hypothetical protein
MLPISLNVLLADVELFHAASGAAFADLLIGDHRETWPIRGKRFRGWLRRCHYQATGEALSAGLVRSALDLLEARAQFDAPERAVHVRVAEHGGRVYLDLADEGWRVRSSPLRRSAFEDRPACCRCPSPSAVARSRNMPRCSTSKATMI